MDLVNAAVAELLADGGSTIITSMGTLEASLERDDDVAGSVEELNAEVDRAGAPINPHLRVQSRAVHARRPFHDDATR